jgi:hypothetical protein
VRRPRERRHLPAPEHAKILKDAIDEIPLLHKAEDAGIKAPRVDEAIDGIKKDNKITSGSPGTGDVPLGLTAAFTAVAALGALAGVRVASGLDPLRLRRAFAVFVIAVGLFLLGRNTLPT